MRSFGFASQSARGFVLSAEPEGYCLVLGWLAHRADGALKVV
jgi:hypothetical protein